MGKILAVATRAQQMKGRTETKSMSMFGDDAWEPSAPKILEETDDNYMATATVSTSRPNLAFRAGNLQHSRLSGFVRARVVYFVYSVSAINTYISCLSYLISNTCFNSLFQLLANYMSSSLASTLGPTI